MSISPDRLRFYLSGGPSNTDPAASIGGPRSSTALSGGLGELFDDVTGDEAVMGETDYRCVYFRNEDVDVDGLIDPVIWVAQQTRSSKIEIGLDPQGKNRTAVSVRSVFDAPVGVEFKAPPIRKAGLVLPGGPYHMDDYIAVWVRRVVQAGTQPGEEQAVLRLAGDTY